MDAFKDRHTSNQLTDSASADWITPPEAETRNDETWRQLFAVSQAELRDARAAMEASRRLSDERQCQLERLTQRNLELRGEVTELQSSLRTARADGARDFAHLRELESEFKEQRSDLERRLSQREAELQALKARYFSDIQVLKSQSSAELETTTKQLSADAEAQRERHELEIQRLKDRHIAEIQKLKDQSANEMETLKTDLLGEIQGLNQLLSAEASRTEAVFEELNATQAQLARKEAEVDALKEIADAAIADAHRQEASGAEVSQASLAELQEMREAMEKLKAEHAEQLQSRVRNEVAAQWAASAEKLKRYSDSLNQDKSAVRKIAERLVEELRQALVLHPLRDYLAMTEKDLSKTELQLRKTPTSSLNRPRLETHLNDLTEQRDYLRSVIEASRRQIAIQSEQVRTLARDLGLTMAPPPPPRTPTSSKA